VNYNASGPWNAVEIPLDSKLSHQPSPGKFSRRKKGADSGKLNGAEYVPARTPPSKGGPTGGHWAKILLVSHPMPANKVLLRSPEKRYFHRRLCSDSRAKNTSSAIVLAKGRNQVIRKKRFSRSSTIFAFGARPHLPCEWGVAPKLRRSAAIYPWRIERLALRKSF